eukprot:64618_1
MVLRPLVYPSFFIWILTHAIQFTSAIWHTGSNTLYYADKGIASGFYGNTIYLLGGDYNQKQLTKYELNTGIFVNVSRFALNVSIQGYAQIIPRLDPFYMQVSLVQILHPII